MPRGRIIAWSAVILVAGVGGWIASRALIAPDPALRPSEIPETGTETQTASRPAPTRSTAVRPRSFEERATERRLAVRVLDGLDRPARSVPMSLYAIQEEDRFAPLGKATTDSEGRADVILPEAAQGRGLVALEVPGAVESVQEIDLSALPAEALTFRLPPCGRMRVRLVDPEGRPIRKRADLRIQAERSKPRRVKFLPSSRFEMVDGEIRIEQVAIDVQLYLTVRPEGSRMVASTGSTGPRQPGEEITVDVALVKHPQLSGRVLDETGQPMRAATLAYELHVEKPHSPDSPGRELVTTEEGRFTVETVASETGRYRLWFRDAATQAMGSADAQSTSVSVDVGDVVLRVPPLLCSGTVVDTSGKPVAGAIVWARQSRGRAWTELQTRVDAEGRFAIHGARESKVTITAEKLHYLFARTELPPGNEPLTLVLRRPGTIEGSVILDERCDPTILVVATDAGIRRPLTKDGTFSFGGFGTERVNFNLHCSDLPVDMSRSSSDRPALATFTAEAVAETKVSVSPIDLRGKLFPVLVTVVDEKGAAVPEYELTVLGKPPEKKTWTSPAPLLLSKPVDLQVAGRGKRLAKLEQVTRDVTVVLREPHRVTVRFKGLPETLPPDVTLLASLQPIGEAMAFIPDARGPVEPDGTATVGLPFAGPWQAGATLRRVTPSMTHYMWASSVNIQVEEIDAHQTFEVTIDPDRFAESLKRLLEQRP